MFAPLTVDLAVPHGVFGSRDTSNAPDHPHIPSVLALAPRADARGANAKTAGAPVSAAGARQHIGEDNVRKLSPLRAVHMSVLAHIRVANGADARAMLRLWRRHLGSVAQVVRAHA